jgi:AraC-like DNA-binding protein
MNGKNDMLSGINRKGQIVLRTMGGVASRERLGAGIMHKPGVTIDTYDRTFEVYSMIYVINGRGEYRDQLGNIYELTPGTVFQRLPGQEHSTRLDPSSNWSEVYVDMGPGLCRGLISSRFIRDDLIVMPLKPDYLLEKQFTSYLSDLKKCPEEELSRMIPDLLTLINHVYSLSYKGQGDENEMVNLARNYFLAHCGERINLKEYCLSNGWGYERFRKAFKDQTALSPGQYIIQKRIDRACEWLMATPLSVKEIGVRLGYPSPYEFSHQFKKNTGRSPRDYRRIQG